MTDTPDTNGRQPLAGCRALDLSGPAGVYCGKLLADLGAEVIKVEPPGGSPMRSIGPFAHDRPGPERSLHWLHFNTSKRSITLDLAGEEGAALLRRLVRESDVLLETGAPGIMDSRGLGYRDLGSLNPGLIYASITPFGQTGPYRDYKGSDLVGFAMGGYMYVTGWPSTPPTRLWGSQAYHTASNRAFIGILMALYHRLLTGKGQHVDVSVQEAVAATTEHVNMAYIYEGSDAVRCGFRHGGRFVATWKCRDGYVSITTHSSQAWRDVREWMAEEGLAGDLMDEKYDDTFVLRGENSAHIEELIGKWAERHERWKITEWGQSRHYPFGPVAQPGELLSNPQLRARGFFVDVEHPEFDATFTYPGAPYKLPRSPWRLSSAAPRIGEHNSVVYTELGLSDEEQARLASEGVI